MKSMTSRDIMTRVKNGEMTHKQAEIKFEELKEEFSRKMTRRNILEMMDNGEL